MALKAGAIEHEKEEVERKIAEAEKLDIERRKSISKMILEDHARMMGAVQRVQPPVAYGRSLVFPAHLNHSGDLTGIMATQPARSQGKSTLPPPGFAPDHVLGPLPKGILEQQTNLDRLKQAMWLLYRAGFYQGRFLNPKVEATDMLHDKDATVLSNQAERGRFEAAWEAFTNRDWGDLQLDLSSTVDALVSVQQAMERVLQDELMKTTQQLVESAKEAVEVAP